MYSYIEKPNIGLQKRRKFSVAKTVRNLFHINQSVKVRPDLNEAELRSKYKLSSCLFFRKVDDVFIYTSALSYGETFSQAINTISSSHMNNTLRNNKPILISDFVEELSVGLFDDRENSKECNREINQMLKLNGEWLIPVVENDHVFGVLVASLQHPDLKHLSKLQKIFLDCVKGYEFSQYAEQVVGGKPMMQISELDQTSFKEEMIFMGFEWIKQFFEVNRYALYSYDPQDAQFNLVSGSIAINKNIAHLSSRIVKHNIVLTMDQQLKQIFGLENDNSSYQLITLTNQSTPCALYIVDGSYKPGVRPNIFNNALTSISLMLDYYQDKNDAIEDQGISKVFNHIPVSILVLNEQLKVTYANQYMKIMLGLDKGSILNKSAAKLFKGNPKLVDLLKANNDLSNIECFYLREGSRKPITVHMRKLEEGGAQKNERIVVISDISQMKKMEQQLLESEQNATLGVIAAGMAHEIRNPLASLKMFSQIMATKSNDQEFWQKNSQIIVDEIGRLEFLLNDFLNISKKKKDYHFQGVKLDEVLLKVINLAELHTKEDAVELKHDLKDIPEIWGDESKLIQLFLNLILNCIQALKEVAKGKIDIKYNVVDDYIIIQMKDNGCGMPEHLQKKVFDAFYTTKESGSGLGLAISKQIVSNHRGKITFKSTVSQGTEFIISFPIHHS